MPSSQSSGPKKFDYARLSHGVWVTVAAGDVSVGIEFPAGGSARALIFDEAMDLNEVIAQAISIACENIVDDRPVEAER